MDNVSKEIKEYGTVKMLLPEAGTFERAVPTEKKNQTTVSSNKK